jgi:hypothetical protein
MTSAGSAPVQLSRRDRALLVSLAVLGAAAAVASGVTDPNRMWANWLLVSYYALTLSLGGLCFVAIHDTSGATWAVALRRVPEALGALTPIAALAVGAVFLARPQLYPWTSGDLGPAPDATLAFKRAWLDWPFFVARALVYGAAWTIFARAVRRRSRRLAGAFLVVFALTFSLAAFDWVMSLEPGWYSTIFGVYHFAGLFLSALAAVVLIALWLERSGPLAGVLHESHLHDLGKLLFAFSTFWAYIWFSQYMLIWYANIPEETTYFISRTQGAWYVPFVLNVVLNWMVPFAVLLRRDTKRNRRVLAAISAIVLLGHWLDLYVMSLPPVLGATPRIGVAELGLAAAGAGLFGLALTRVVRAAPVVPVEHPDLPASLQYES